MVVFGKYSPIFIKKKDNISNLQSEYYGYLCGMRN